MHVTPELMEASYRLLLTALPFRRWSMPDPDKVDFLVSLHRHEQAHHRAYDDKSGRHEVSVSASRVKTLQALTECMAHEMVHIRQDALGMRDKHGVGFKRLAKLVCQRNGFDVATF